MPISLRCECGKELQAKDEFAGRRTQCPNCGRELVIPMPAVAANPYEAGPAFDVGPPKTAPYSSATRTSGMAIASLVLGIVSCGCGVLSVPGIVLGILGLNETKDPRGPVKGRGLAIAGVATSSAAVFINIIAVLIALLLPAVQAAREAARRVQCMNNLKQVGLAMHNFESDHSAFPAQAISDANGKPLLSWRVAILPYVDEKALYDEFHLDEPWDSPHNKSLLPRMPKLYACPSSSLGDEAARGLTHYQVMAGPGTIMDPREARSFPGGVTKGARVGQVPDGLSNTILVIEASDGVEWTRPQDLTFTPNGPLPDVGSKHPGGVNVLFADGAVRFLRGSVADESLEALITRDGGEVVDREAY